MSEGAVALRGRLALDDDGQFTVGDRSLSELLRQHEGSELVVILAQVDASPHLHTRQCGTCGHDYEGDECPRCASARARLRGH